MNNLIIKLVVLSFAMSIDENSEIKLIPKTVIPGVSLSMLNIVI